MEKDPEPLTEEKLQALMELMLRDEVAGIRAMIEITEPYPIRMVGPKPPFL